MQFTSCECACAREVSLKQSPGTAFGASPVMAGQHGRRVRLRSPGFVLSQKLVSGMWPSFLACALWSRSYMHRCRRLLTVAALFDWHGAWLLMETTKVQCTGVPARRLAPGQAQLNGPSGVAVDLSWTQPLLAGRGRVDLAVRGGCRRWTIANSRALLAV